MSGTNLLQVVSTVNDLLTTCYYLRATSELLESFGFINLVRRYDDDDDNLFQTSQQLGTGSANRISILLTNGDIFTRI